MATGKEDKRKSLPHLFKNGKSGNPKGRPPGPNKKQEKWLELRDTLMNEGAQKFWEEMNTLKGEKYCQMYIQVANYFAPKLAAVAQQVKIETPTIEYVESSNSANANTNGKSSNGIDEANIVE